MTRAEHLLNLQNQNDGSHWWQMVKIKQQQQRKTF